MGRYRDAYRRSLEDPEAFWLEAAHAVDWTRPPTRALDAERPPVYRWFPDGELNTSANALDRHVDAGRGEHTALIWDSPVTGMKRRYTYRGLRDLVARFAG
ncbi:MAG: acetyl-coenzyme A synthetase N-terminal domain-containing protein, partial [Solirubrobacteraceae bacterium]